MEIHSPTSAARSLKPGAARVAKRLGRTGMSTDKRGTKILARTFYGQLRTSGYSSNQIIDLATELLDLVTCELRDGDRAQATVSATASAAASAPPHRAA